MVKKILCKWFKSTSQGGNIATLKVGKKLDPVTMLSQGKTRAKLAEQAKVSEGTLGDFL